MYLLDQPALGRCGGVMEGNDEVLVAVEEAPFLRSVRVWRKGYVVGDVFEVDHG